MKGILSGILIALGGYGFLVLGGIPGACIFAFGLISILYFEIPSYVETAGTIELHPVKLKQSLGNLFLVLFQNLLGCGLVALLFRATADSIVQGNVQALINTRLALGFWTTFFKAVGCGIIIDICVYIRRNTESMLPVLFGVPLFILCGFIHTVADTFYLLCSPGSFGWGILWYYPCIILGNLVGCSFRRIFRGEIKKKD